METRPEVTQPEATKAEVAQPEATQAEVAKPEATQPDITQRKTKAKKITYYILGVLETLFTFRLVFKILGANPESAFVKVI